MNGSILYVDDACFSNSIEKFIEDVGEYIVVRVFSGNEAIDLIENNLKYNLALIDLSLPDVDGCYLIKYSKKINPKIPVLSISGYDFMPNGSNFHIRKPIRPSKLLKIIEDYINK